ncbi:MAG: hypothetical protein QQW96_20690, partial [Tychonema bourrellyi B0820]|nr:hypothetical protein [Tychonema bourrellyi B0820]
SVGYSDRDRVRTRSTMMIIYFLTINPPCFLRGVRGDRILCSFIKNWYYSGSRPNYLNNRNHSHKILVRSIATD